MRIADFGRISGPVALFGGPYSNLQATEAFLAETRGLAAICTGDVVAYGADAAATVALVREAGLPVVAGNCERQVARGAEDCGCGFETGSACDLLSRGWYPAALEACDETARAWMADLPDMGVFEQDGRRYAVIHGGATEISRFIWPSSPEGHFAEEIQAVEAVVGPVDGIVAGHCGIAFQRRVAGRHWINAGVIGLPPHDGRPETRYAVLDAGEVVVQRLSYDHTGALAAMERKGLTQGYELTLANGIWPSEDVLPEEIRRQPSAAKG
ncbi:metallophosphoesterase [Silicimonas algicola]|uniref:Calcineurin-like phosphoesterase family protein n=1 Tax=Silicimonas algicola TaxID=1826607 RepID=A0A316GF49_9RHOB|nr:metallophosphoesterase family protein [Silicimonas algicola]AZQ66268.1 metallophosphoesterase [Silicimonas algicola]PWK58586.1 calcineurin-like phosphoesterase family protein [Silicimonas algicola]